MITLAIPCSMKTRTWDHEIYKFSRGLPGQHNYELRFFFQICEVERKFLENGQIFNLPFWPCPLGNSK